MTALQPRRYILPVIVLAQLCCTSLWFAGNGVMDDLATDFALPQGALGVLTSMVQFGFIAGTVVFALLAVADRFSPSKVFFWCAVFGAGVNAAVMWDGNTYASLIAWRFLTGFWLAGIYPVGMKIAADYYEQGLGKALGYLVGALVLGTALPHLLKDLLSASPWQAVLVLTSSLALLGGLAMRLLVPDGPYRTPGSKVQLRAISSIFQSVPFRRAVAGYVGHMWELYAFWAFVPVLLALHQELHAGPAYNVSLWTFAIIGMGGVGCVVAGYLAGRWGPRKVAAGWLGLSGMCCLLAPVVLTQPSQAGVLAFLLVWGTAVVADSPLLSTLVATHAPPALKGTALTLVNAAGFAVTIVSIQWVDTLMVTVHRPVVLVVLAAGPVLGVLALVRRGTVAA